MSCIFQKSKFDQNPLAKLPARTILLVFLLFSTSIMTTLYPGFYELGVYSFILISLIKASAVSPKEFSKRSLIILPLIIFLFFAYISKDGNYNSNLRNINILKTTIFITWKSALLLLSVLLLSETLEFDRFIKTLKTWRVPDTILLIIMLAYGYIDVMIDSLRTKSLAWNSRKYNASRFTKLITAARAAGLSILSAVDREHQIFLAGKARSFRGRLRFLTVPEACFSKCKQAIIFLNFLILVKIIFLIGSII